MVLYVSKGSMRVMLFSAYISSISDRQLHLLTSQRPIGVLSFLVTRTKLAPASHSVQLGTSAEPPKPAPSGPSPPRCRFFLNPPPWCLPPRVTLTSEQALQPDITTSVRVLPQLRATADEAAAASSASSSRDLAMVLCELRRGRATSARGPRHSSRHRWVS